MFRKSFTELDRYILYTRIFVVFWNDCFGRYFCGTPISDFFFIPDDVFKV